ncbi:MAG: HPP family protein [Betaproteobacteria bacterium]
MHAADVMSRPVLTVRDDDPIEQATTTLTVHNITSAPVVDATGDLVGVVSENDLLSAREPPATTSGLGRAAPGERPNVVADVMTREVVVVPLEADLSTVAEAMLHNHVRSVAVVDDTAGLTGIVSRHDILRTMVRTDDIIRMEVQHRLDDYASGERRWTATVRGGSVEVLGRFADDAERRIVGVLAHTVAGVTTVDLRPPPERPEE